MKNQNIYRRKQTRKGHYYVLPMKKTKVAESTSSKLIEEKRMVYCFEFFLIKFEGASSSVYVRMS